MNQFELIGEPRTGLGKGDARRLRRAGRVPAVLYGAGEAPRGVTFSRNVIEKQLENEAFFSHVLNLKVDGVETPVVLKALQRDPITARVAHVDLQRVSQAQALHIHVPLHYVNEEHCVGRRAGGLLNHHMIEVEISCLPRDLPEYIEVDVTTLEVGSALHLRDLVLPAGVSLVAHGSDLEHPVVSVQHAQKLEVEPVEGAGGEAADTAGTTPPVS